MPALARRLAAAAVPDALKRRHERWATARYLEAIRAPTEEYVRRHGTTVRHGPFAGMDYAPGAQSWSNDAVPKLLGTYERELHPPLQAWIDACVPHVVDVGCAEGYYAVGFARAGAQVHAYDIDPAARERTAALAARNGVSVEVGGECTPATLQALPAEGVALLADCEGYERELLDPGAAPKLARWEIVVELHEFLDPEIAGTIAERFAATHELTLLEEQPRAVPEELAFLDEPTARLLLSERRPARMRWAVLRPA